MQVDLTHQCTIGYKTSKMLTADAYIELWRALEEEEERRIEKIRSDGRPAREALVTLWQRFHPNEPPPTNRHLLISAEVDSDAPPLISGIRLIIDNLAGPFTTQVVTQMLDHVMPEQRASERRVSVSSYLSRLASEGMLEVVQRQPNGLANVYAKSDRWRGSAATPRTARTAALISSINSRARQFESRTERS